MTTAQPGAGAPSSLFVRDGDAFVATTQSTGPWSSDALHGGPVAALVAHELAAVPTRYPMFPARFTLELWRPVGFEPYRVDCRVIRGGARVQVLEATLARLPERSPEPDTIVGRATLQQVVDAPVDLPDDVEERNGPDQLPPGPDAFPPVEGSLDLPARDAGPRFHHTAVEHRAPHAFFLERGPALDWVRIRCDLVPGVPLGAFERVVGAADFGNGLSGVLPFDKYLFVNPDLTVHLYRLPVDEWVCLDAITRMDTGGTGGSVGLAESTLFDRRGRIGRSLQSLLISRRD
jgi:hypothetical protein